MPIINFQVLSQSTTLGRALTKPFTIVWILGLMPQLTLDMTIPFIVFISNIKL